MEGFLHRHYYHFHFASEISEELFKLPQEEAEGFETTTAGIERHLLAIEILRLKGLLLKFEAECQE